MEGLMGKKRGIMRMNYNDDKLIKKAIKGNKEAFAKVITNNIDYLYKIAYMHLKDEQKSLDAIQECSYKGFISIKKLKEEKYFKSWITRILINICIDEIRKTSKLTYLNDDTPLINNSISITVEEKIDLYNAIDDLKAEYRTVIILKYFNDLSIEAISDITDTPINTVKTRLSRARKVLSIALKEEI